MAKKRKAKPEPMDGIRKLTLKLTGTRTLLMHNGRLSSPLDPYTQAIAAISKKKNKTLDDYRQLAQLELRGGMYETEDGKLGVPMGNIWKTIQEGATAFKLGRDVQRALRYEPAVIPISVNGNGGVKCEEYQERPEALHYVPVGIQKRRTMRARPQVAAGWTLTPNFELDETVLPLDKLMPVLERSGKYVGLCEQRPLLGTFEVEVLT